MKNRKRIGLYYTWLSEWMGGRLYAQNLLKALNMLCDEDKPYIDVYCKEYNVYDSLKSNTDYPYLAINIIKANFRTKLYGWFLHLISKKKWVTWDHFKLLPNDLFIYPYNMGSHPERLVYWHPDFQDKYMPEYFSQREIEERDLGMHLMATRKIPIVFSSYTCERDYRKFYPENQNKSFVVHFAVDHSNFVNVNIATVKKKYGIVGDYLLCANQFWKHKNHLFLFKAYHKALQKGLNVQLICTGELTDYRNPDYIEEIKRFIHVNNLTDCIKILGLIDGNDLHCLMKHSYAVVQPSLFEGWNTTVEDCKAINKFIFISDIPVHREQVESNVCFFNPHDEKDLAMKLLTVNPTNEIYDYSKKMQEFGLSFLNVINYMENLQCERQQE